MSDAIKTAAPHLISQLVITPMAPKVNDIVSTPKFINSNCLLSPN
jgi:hypothetical protein